MYGDIVGSRARVAIQPYDSHGNITLTGLAVISVLLAGDVPGASDGLRDTLPLALNWTSPWGGEGGSFANRTAYAQRGTREHWLPWSIPRSPVRSQISHS